MRKIGIIYILPFLLTLIGACNENAPLNPEEPSILIPAANISGVGSGIIQAVEITDGVGYCDIEGERIPAIVYKAQYWDTFGINVFHTIAPTINELHVLYFYSAADTLQWVWHESYTQPLDYERASGTVIYDGQEISSMPELWCLETVPEDNQLVSGVSISGSQLNWSSGLGTIEIDNQVYELYPFKLVDCLDCGSNANDGWYELHSVLRGPQDEMEFGILYLHVDNPGVVNLHYRIQLCEMQLGTSVMYEADWVLDIDTEKSNLQYKRSLPRSWGEVR
ncbi:MAG: hypothetical protein GY746_05850 [Gammaproteobacteria bacterium]|nr:hypothetical protein [Gammaproteobacteria bacterium]